MKRLLVLGIVVVSFFLVATVRDESSGAEPIAIRLSHSMPPQNFTAKQCVEWGKLVEQNSGGELKVQVFDSAQLYRDHESIKAVQTGSIEAALVGSPWVATQLVPTMRIWQIPFLFHTVDETVKVERSKIGATMREAADKKGVKLFGYVVFPTPEDSIIATKKPVKVPADLKGMMVRVASPDEATVIKHWGAGPSFLAGTEIYMALQRGTINGSIGAVLNYVELKRYEVAPYAIYVPLSVMHLYFGINKPFFDKLTPKQQKAIVDASTTIENNTKDVAMKTLVQNLEEVKGKATFYRPTAQELALWKQGVTELWPEMVKDNKELADTLAEVKKLIGR
jgi:TRAP-type C4-dicarboxylate transport system substrate-binding protein